jgi:hypothetical protein
LTLLQRSDTIIDASGLWQRSKEARMAMSRTIGERIARFVPTELTFDESLLGERDRQVLRKVVEAARLMDEIFLRQVSPRNPEWLARLESSDQAADRDLWHYFRIMYGPWDRLEEHRPFMGEEEKPLGAGFYPPDLTKEELEDWLAASPEDEEAFRGFYTVITREGGGLAAVPYSRAYAEFLQPAARLLEEAAEKSDNPSLARFLASRAEAFRTNDYFQSEMDWLDVEDSLIDVTIGPYEVYEDRLLGYKAAFEAMIGITDPEASEKLQALVQYAPELERNLPGFDQYAVGTRGASSPISVIDGVFSAGDARAGVQPVAFLLPNDERVWQAKGSRKVMLRNVGEAKFRSLVVPVGARAISEVQASLLAFDLLYNFILMHELAHGMGPSSITLPDGSQTTVSLVLKELMPAVEEAKADLAGMYCLLSLIDDGVLPDLERTCVSYVVSELVNIRFGIDEAHGRAALLQLNFLLERGGLTYETRSGRFQVDYDRMREAIEDLTRRVLALQARGDYEGVELLLDTYGILTAPLEATISAMGDLPVDIEPVFPIEEMMESW